MEKLTFKFEVFEGPLDLLLSLIEKHKINIFDIEISILLEQYLQYLKTIEENNLTITSEFLEMASQLVYIKSYMLLPKSEPEIEDPKLELERMLIEYTKYKHASAELTDVYLGNKIFLREFENSDLPKIEINSNFSADKLLEAYNRILYKNNNKKPISVNSFSSIINTKFVSIHAKILRILRIMTKKNNISFASVFDDINNRSDIVATFLAILELIRLNRISVFEDDPNEIMLQLNRKK